MSLLSIQFHQSYWLGININRIRLFLNCNSYAVSLLICMIWIRYPPPCLFLRVFQLGKQFEEMRCNRYKYTYLAISCCLVVSLNQILVAFTGFSLESSSVGAVGCWCVSVRYCWDGAVSKRRKLYSERLTQDLVGACRSELSEDTKPMNIRAATKYRRPSPLVVIWVW